MRRLPRQRLLPALAQRSRTWRHQESRRRRKPIRFGKTGGVLIGFLTVPASPQPGARVPSFGTLAGVPQYRQQRSQ